MLIKVINKVKIEHYKNIFKDTNLNPGKLWNHVKCGTNQKNKLNRTITAITDNQNSTITDNKVVHEFNNYYNQIGDNLFKNVVKVPENKFRSNFEKNK